MESLNRPRLLYILDKWFSTATVPGVEETNLSEPLLFGAAFIPNYFPHGFRTSLGCSLQWALDLCREADVKALYSATVATFGQDNYMLCGSLKDKQLHITYRPGITAQEELEAVLTAYLCVINYIHFSEGALLSGEYVAEGLSATTPDSEFIAKVRHHAHKIFPTFLHNLQAKGWHINRLLLAADEWRVL